VRRRFDAWLRKVFDLFGLVACQAEGRQPPRYPWVEVFTALLLGVAAQTRSLVAIEAACRRGWPRRRVGPISDNTLVYAMDHQDWAQMFALGCTLARRIKRNGLLRSSWARGYVVAAVDGLEICHSYQRCCSACLERRVERKVGGQIQTAVEYYHRLVMVVVVSGRWPVPLGLRFQQPGESEVACALALLEDLLARLGRRYFDLLGADALYLQAPFIRRLEQLGLRWVMSLKNNQPDLAATAERLMTGPPQGSRRLPEGQLDYWYLPELYWPAADRTVSLLKTLRRCPRRRSLIRDKKLSAARQRQTVEEVTTNYYASNLGLGLIPPLFLYQLGRSRWRIDTEVFQTLTVDCHLKHAAAHRPTALPVWTMIRVLAYTLSLIFYHRQILTHSGHGTPASFREFAQRLCQLAPAWDAS
jgi:hypothetical protein